METTIVMSVLNFRVLWPIKIEARGLIIWDYPRKEAHRLHFFSSEDRISK